MSKRRVYLVNPSFQLKVVGYTLMLVVLTTGIFYMSNLYFIWKFIDIDPVAQRQGAGAPQ